MDTRTIVLIATLFSALVIGMVIYTTLVQTSSNEMQIPA